jgi:phosphoribosylanthranilate isomerase
MSRGASQATDSPIVRVKICGITNWPDARAALDLGAAWLGFNFYPPSPRSISPAEAWEIRRRLPRSAKVAGVFVNWTPRAVTALGQALSLDAVQLHGDECPRHVSDCARHKKVFKAFRAGPGFRVGRLAFYSTAFAFLLDGQRAGFYGGSGRVADWTLARRAAQYGRIILAGGLSPENVAEAIREAQSYAVDVASGVESRPGKKDRAKLRAFFREVERASRALAAEPRRNHAA